jgi:hypothetical protein
MKETKRPKLVKLNLLQDRFRVRLLEAAGQSLAGEVDDAFTEAFNLGQDDAVEAVASGAKVEGYLTSPDGFTFGAAVSVALPLTIPLNPPCDPMDCSFITDMPHLHALLLGFEDYDAAFAGEIVASLIADDPELGVGNDLCDKDPQLFSDFVHHHNWRNPSRMSDLASLVERAAVQSQSGRKVTA